jgi:hypothetical protein
VSLLPPILYRTPLTDRQTLLVARPWQQYFQALETRVGGPNAPTILELAAALAALGSLPTDLAALTLRVAALEAAAARHQGTPSVQAVTLGAGSGASASVSGTDRAGTLTLTTASGQARRSHSAVLTLTFAAAYPAQPVVTLTPANDAAWALPVGTVRLRQADVTTTTFTLRSGRTRLPRARETFQWTYQTSEV